MSGSTTYTPTLAGFQTFITQTMGISSTALPSTSSAISMAFNVAMEVVNPYLNQASSLIYTLCVYNLAGSNLINFAQDQPGQTYFNDLRATLGSNSLTIGEPHSASDQGTSAGLVTPDFVKQMSLSDLQLAKDPYGRQYLIFAQKYGPSLWGLS